MKRLAPLRSISILSTLFLSFGIGSPELVAREMQLVGSPALSPDGSEIAFSFAGDIWTVPVAGGIARRLTIHPANESTPAYSPDGKQIAYVSDRTGDRQVFLQPTSGGPPRQISFHSEGYLIEEWSPDGASLLTLGQRDHHWKRPQRLISLNTEKRSAEAIVFDAYAQQGRWSPDGTQMLFCREGTQWWRKGYVGSQASQIWLYDTASKEFTQLLNDPRGSRSPLWKPDGLGFYFVGAESGSFNLHVYDFASKETRQLTHFEDDSVVMPCISRDGKTIVFRHLFDLYSWQPEGKKTPVKITISASGDDPRDETIRRTLTTANNVAFTPDGLEIVFAAGGNLWAMDTVLREPVPVTQGVTQCTEPVLIYEGKTLLFLREVEGQVDLYQAKPSEPGRYWWQNSDFEIKRLSNDGDTESNLQKSPDGEHIAVAKKPGGLWLFKLDGTPVRKLVSGFDVPDYQFSPDGRWIVYSQEDDDFNDEVWILPTDGSRPPFNLSRHPDDDVSPVWSPDGKRIAFVSRREGDEADIYYVFLKAAEDELSARDKKLKEALEKLQKARPSTAASTNSNPQTSTSSTNSDSSSDKVAAGAPKNEDQSASSEKSVLSKTKSNLPQVEIDFENLHERLHRVSIPNTREGGLFWLPDGKTLAFSASINGASGTYAIIVNENLTPKRLSTETGNLIQSFTSKDKVGWLSAGKPGTLSVKGPTESYSFSVKEEFTIGDRFQAGFDVAWRLMSDHWYDENFGNRNWPEIRRKYRDAAAAAPDESAFTEVVQLMLGELNGSHLGFYSNKLTAANSRPAWSSVTPHLGLRFETSFKGPGLKVRDTILAGPAERAESRILPQEIVLSIDGHAVDPALDLTQILNGELNRDIALLVRSVEGTERNVTIRPTTYSSVRSRLYGQFESETAKKVEELSDGKLGYIHIQGMNMASFLVFERQLYNVGYGKEGLIIDVRENGGGSTSDHLLTILTQPQHAITVPRGGGPGYPQDRKIYATWNKPIVVLCNQNSFSNAEIFSHAIKTLKRGRVVGVTTAGGVISTGAASVMDLGTIRQPFRGWYLLDGEDMELNGARPHFELWPQPGELPQGKDVQLVKAIEVLQKDVKRAQRRTSPALRKATEKFKTIENEGSQ